MSDYRDLRGTEDHTIVDLSPHFRALEELQDIASLLSDEEEQKLVDFARACMDMSHSRISKRYPHWKEADRAHDVYVPDTSTQFREKAVITDTRAIADTVQTYLMAALAGRNPMFQLEGLNRESRKVSMILERVLHQHMRRTAGEARVAQMMQDAIRYGFAPTKIVWDSTSNHNRIINFDPRRTFPDPRVSWGDWESMGFIGFTDFVTYNNLLRSGLYPKLKRFPAMRNRLDVTRLGWLCHQYNNEEGRGWNIDPSLANERSSTIKLSNANVVDELWVNLAGYEVGLPNVESIWLLLTILDEQYVIRCQLNPYGQQFPTVMGGIYHDSHKTYGQSLYDLLLPLHDVATWLLRSRIDNVQAALNNLIFADPTQVSIPDLIDRNPWGVVRTMPGTNPGDGVFIAQVPDVTRGHWNDIGAISELKNRTAAASDAQQGVPTPDVRTATEIQRLTQLGSQRLGVMSRIMSATTIRPMVRMMVANIQDALPFQGSIRVDPFDMPSQLAGSVEDDYIDYESNVDLQGSVDYLVVDGTLPLEPTRNAETWMSILQIMHQTGLNMEYNSGKIAEEAIRAMGISDLDQFRISPEQLQQGMSPSQQMAMMEKARGASVQPEGEVQSQVSQGNLTPMRAA